jgi:hypothetical protein
MTDAELDALFRKHIPRNEWHIDPRAPFIGSRFYAFARELEHHSLAAGLLIGASDPVRPALADQPDPRPSRLSGFGRLWAAFSALVIGSG